MNRLPASIHIHIHIRAIACLLLAAGAMSAAETAPLNWGNSLLSQKPEWYATPEARVAADSVLRYQSPEGAWPKNTDLLAPLTDAVLAKIKKNGEANTIDNDATTTPMRFLALVASAAPGENRPAQKYRDAVRRGLDYLLASQYPNGGFPQFYPLRPTGYYSRITYNDNAMINALELLREVAEKRAPWEFINTPRRERAAAAVARGIDCILKTQIRQDGKLTAWCAQHDEKTLAPAWARAYEPPSLSGAESVGIVRFLMAIKNPSPEVKASIEGAVAWFRQVPITGQRLTTRRNPDDRMERILVPDPAAPSIWARFYELGTNRPLYMDRDSKLNYDYNKVSYERRSGYNYNGTWPATLLDRDYPAWRARQTDSAKAKHADAAQAPAPHPWINPLGD